MMQDWVYDIGAIAACCMAFVLLLSLVRIFVLMLKVVVIGGILLFVGKTYVPEFSLDSIPREKVMEYASQATIAALTFGEGLLRDSSAESLFKAAKPHAKTARGLRASTPKVDLDPRD